MGGRVNGWRYDLRAYGWDWQRFRGSTDALKYAQRDLWCLERVLTMTPGRQAVCQAGGNLGIWPKRLARDFAAVYTCEPASDLFAMLMHNAPEPNIVKLQAALGDRHEGIGLSRNRRDPGPGKRNHEGITHVAGPGPIPTLRVDDFEWPVLDLLYLDLEGWELYALRGAVATLARCRPTVAVEVNKNLGFVGLTPSDLYDFLAAQGYRAAGRLQSDEVFVPVERAA